MATLLEQWQHSGTHTFRWEPEHSPTGVYFLRLESGKETVSTKLAFTR